MGIILLLMAAAIEVGFTIWMCTSGKMYEREKWLVRAGGVLFLILLLLLGVLEGLFRYGMLIGVLLIQTVICGYLMEKRKREGTEKALKKAGVILAAAGSILLYAAALFPAFLFPQYKEPKVTGEHEVLTATYTWVDESRQETYADTGEHRELTVKFWYPQEDNSKEGYPLVVFSHGAFGVIDSNYSTCKELASNGYVVASIAHTYQAMYVENTEGKIRIVNQNYLKQVYEENGTSESEGEKIVYDNSREWMKIRSEDANFVLDTILEKAAEKKEKPFAEINTEKIGMFGHSMGGATAVEMGRERNDIDAVIDLEGTMFGEYVDFQDGKEVFNDTPYPIPILDVNSVDVDKQVQELGDSYVNVYLGERAADYRYTTVAGAGHLNFTDLPIVSPMLAKMLGTGDVNARECIEHVNEMVLDYFDRYLKGRDDIIIKTEY